MNTLSVFNNQQDLTYKVSGTVSLHVRRRRTSQVGIDGV